MEYKNILVSLVAVFALAIVLMTSASAFVSQPFIVEVDGVTVAENGGVVVSAYAGQTIPVRVIFTALSDATDVRVKAEISGGKGYDYVSERFDVLAGHTESRLFQVRIPSNIEVSEPMQLDVTIEGKSANTLDANREVAARHITLGAKRESYVVEILDVAMDSTVQAGETLALDIVLKNRGRHFSEDMFVKVSIPALGIERRAYFGDLAPVDQSDPDKEDAAERRMLLNIPSNAPAGVYALDIEATSEDSTTEFSKKFAIVGAQGNSAVVSPTMSKTVAAGEEASYSITLVNSGKNVRVYELVIDAPADLSVVADEPFVAIPAGTSKTVTIVSQSNKAGKHAFTVNVYAEGNLVDKKSFTTTVEGKSRLTSGATPNMTVVLTVILAIIFVVLLVVLIVLLTRKPQKSEEFGESYY